jgi:hypothetical protein
MALVEQLAQHQEVLLAAGFAWFAPAAGQRWLALLRDFRDFRAGR